MALKQRREQAFVFCSVNQNTWFLVLDPNKKCDKKYTWQVDGNKK